MQNKGYIQSGTLKILLSAQAPNRGTKGVKKKGKGLPHAEVAHKVMLVFHHTTQGVSVNEYQVRHLVNRTTDCLCHCLCGIQKWRCSCGS